MALYTRESRDRVRDAVDFVELVSARTELRRAGPARYEGLCPFHEERTPSFGIDPGQKVYYCFGCQASGDVFTFVQETEGLDFKGALELLADRYGVELSASGRTPRRPSAARAASACWRCWRARAPTTSAACGSPRRPSARGGTWQSGGSPRRRCASFQWAMRPSAWNRVLKASRSGGFTVQELYATGLAQRSKENGQPYDRFRSRIMFPLADIRGRVLGFGARAIGDGPAAEVPEHVRQRRLPQGPHLYGAHLARPHATRAGSVILCEGYTDVIALHQAGIRNAVGLMGTALTAEQVAELARMAQTVLLALDADTAGQEAMLRAATLAASRKLELRVVPLPAGPTRPSWCSARARRR